MASAHNLSFIESHGVPKQACEGLRFKGVAAPSNLQPGSSTATATTTTTAAMMTGTLDDVDILRTTPNGALVFQGRHSQQRISSPNPKLGL